MYKMLSLFNFELLINPFLEEIQELQDWALFETKLWSQRLKSPNKYHTGQT